MTSETTTHPADCLLCKRLDAGEAQTRNGVDIPPLCGVCATHHWPSMAHAAGSLLPHICPRCRENKRAVVHVMPAMRPDRMKLGDYCEACYEAEGYRRCVYEMRDGVETWQLVTYEKPTKHDMRRTLARLSADPFEGLVD